MKIKSIQIIITLFFMLFLLCGCEKVLENESSTPETSNQQTNSEVMEKENKKENIKDSKEDNIIDISSDVYFDLVKNIFEKSALENGYFEYGGYDTYKYPYIQLYIAPKDKYSEDVTKVQSTELIKNVLEQLKEYEYKSGGFFKRNFEYINVHFYGYDEYGEYHRNGGPFIKINITDIQNVTEEKLIF